MNIICLDAEFADNEELLELSVFNMEGEEIYHRYYRPENITQWRTDIHHITPEMVEGKPSFAECRKEVEILIEKAFAITGFAVDNDLRVLTRSGVRGLDSKRVIDVKDMYWYMRGRKEEMTPFGVPSLIVCSNALGFDFEEGEAHSASADTRVTLRCFNLLFSEFGMEEGESLPQEDALLLLADKIQNAKALFVEEQARGFIKVYKSDDVYKIKYGRLPDTDGRGLVMEVPVNDRYKAEYEVRKLLKKKEIPDKYSTYRLTSALLDKLRTYENSYDAEESAWCKKIVRNLSRLTL